jgi:hypothetical protein
MSYGMILCDDCYVTMLLRDAARRNRKALERLRDPVNGVCEGCGWDICRCIEEGRVEEVSDEP